MLMYTRPVLHIQKCDANVSPCSNGYQTGWFSNCNTGDNVSW